MKLIVLAVLVGLPLAPAPAAICRDVHGHIVKCIRNRPPPPPPGCRDRHGHLIPCSPDGSRMRHRRY